MDIEEEDRQLSRQTQIAMLSNWAALGQPGRPPPEFLSIEAAEQQNWNDLPIFSPDSPYYHGEHRGIYGPDSMHHMPAAASPSLHQPPFYNLPARPNGIYNSQQPVQQPHQHATRSHPSARALRHAQSLNTLSHATQPYLGDRTNTSRSERSSVRRLFQDHARQVASLQLELRNKQDEIAALQTQLDATQRDLGSAIQARNSQAARYDRDWMTRAKHEVEIQQVHRQYRSEIWTLRKERDRLRLEVRRMSGVHDEEMAQDDESVAVVDRRLEQQSEELEARDRAVRDFGERDDGPLYQLESVWGKQATG